MKLWENIAVAEPLTYESLMRAAEQIKNMKPIPHHHLVSPGGYRRLQQGGTAFCVSCGTKLG